MMPRAIQFLVRSAALAATLLCTAGLVQAGLSWPPGESAPEPASPLLADRPFEEPALMRFLSSQSEGPSAFAQAADLAAAESVDLVATIAARETQSVEPAEVEAPAVVAAVSPAPVPASVTPPVALPPADEKAAVVTAPTAAPEPVVTGPGVLEQLAFETTLAAQFAGRAPAPELQPVWSRIAELYHEHGDRPFWRDGGSWSPSARSVLARIALARDDALTLPALAPASLVEGTPEMIAAQDLALTSAVVAYARQASGSRVDPLRISRLITAKPSLPEPRDIIGAVAQAGDHASDVLAAFNPPHAGYRALRAKLGELRHASTPMATRIPAGPALRVGMRDPRVKLIRTRFGLEIDPPQSADDILYDTQVAEAVAGFQREKGLTPNGVLTPRTVALLSGGEPGKLENAIIVNMERWRWLPRDLGTDRIEVNVPAYSLSLVRDGKVVHRARVIVGKPTNPTPVFSNAMKFIVVNPSWYIPPSILKKEILPKLAGDPGYLARLGYEMTVKHGQVSVRQPPGERNALGRIKFMFPNEHSVYLHDTPSRSLFASTRRAFSHGCVRVDDPMALAAAVLRGQWTAARIQSLVGRGERTLNLSTPLPIHIEYFTAAIGTDGRLQFHDDLYGYDRAVMRALALND